MIEYKFLFVIKIEKHKLPYCINLDELQVTNC